MLVWQMIQLRRRRYMRVLPSGDDRLRMSLFEHHDDKGMFLPLRHIAKTLAGGRPWGVMVTSRSVTSARSSNVGAAITSRSPSSMTVSPLGSTWVRTVAQHQYHQHVRCAANVRERASGKRMPSAHQGFTNDYAVLVAVVVKGAAYVAGRIDHIEASSPPPAAASPGTTMLDTAITKTQVK